MNFRFSGYLRRRQDEGQCAGRGAADQKNEQTYFTLTAVIYTLIASLRDGKEKGT